MPLHEIFKGLLFLHGHVADPRTFAASARTDTDAAPAVDPPCAVPPATPALPT